MIIADFKNKMGEMSIKYDDGATYRVDIYKANCLAAFIYNNGKQRELYSFFLDEKHARRVIEAGVFSQSHSVVSCIKLNWKYKESEKLTKIFASHGFKVIAYTK